MRITSRRDPENRLHLTEFLGMAGCFFASLWLFWLLQIFSASLLILAAWGYYAYVTRPVHFVLELCADRLIYSEAIYSETSNAELPKWSISAGHVQAVRRDWKRRFLRIQLEKSLVFTDIQGREYRARAQGFVADDIEALLARLPLLQAPVARQP